MSTDIALVARIASLLPVAFALSSTIQSAAAAEVDAVQFWNLYFRNQFIVLERKPDRYDGQLNVADQGAAEPAKMLRRVRASPVHVNMESLRRYDYGTDGRFAIRKVLEMDVATAFDAIIQRTYPYRDAAPFSRERMSELFLDLQARLPASGRSSPSLPVLEEGLRSMIAQPGAPKDQAIAALAWFLGERREPSSAAVLSEVLRASSYVRTQPPTLHFSAVDAAFSAAWKINAKERIEELLEIMRLSNTTGRWKFGQLFERLLSQDELLGIHKVGNAYGDPDYWQAVVARVRPESGRGWSTFDARSLFWEARFLAAGRLTLQDQAALQLLAQDEVGPVRDRARRRLGGN